METIIRKHNLFLAKKIMGLLPKAKPVVKVDIHDPNFNISLTELEKNY